MTSEEDIVYQVPGYFVTAYDRGFKLWQEGALHATLRGQYGHGYLARAKADADKICHKGETK